MKVSPSQLATLICASTPFNSIVRIALGEEVANDINTNITLQHLHDIDNEIEKFKTNIHKSYKINIARTKENGFYVNEFDEKITQEKIENLLLEKRREASSMESMLAVFRNLGGSDV